MTYCDDATTAHIDGFPFYIRVLPAPSPAGSTVTTPACVTAAAVLASPSGSGHP